MYEFPLQVIKCDEQMPCNSSSSIEPGQQLHSATLQSGKCIRVSSRIENRPRVVYHNHIPTSTEKCTQPLLLEYPTVSDIVHVVHSNHDAVGGDVEQSEFFVVAAILSIMLVTYTVTDKYYVVFFRNGILGEEQT